MKSSPAQFAKISATDHVEHFSKSNRLFSLHRLQRPKLTCQKYFDEPTSHSVKRKLQLVIKTAHTKTKETTSVWHTQKVARIGCPGPATSKRKSRTTAIFDRTLEHSPRACVSADLDPSRFWIPYDVTHCLGMRSSLKCRKVTYKMCVAHPRKWIRFLLAGRYSFG